MKSRGLIILVLTGALHAGAVLATEPPPAAAAERAAVDHLRLEATAVTGNRELPKVMSIVPWKAPEPLGGPERPMGSLIEEVLSPLDRDEFRREITYFRDLTPQSNPIGAPPAAAAAAGALPESRRSDPSGPPGASMP
jgi:hypothetical protein